jgi:hypothetical protein
VQKSEVPALIFYQKLLDYNKDLILVIEGGKIQEKRTGTFSESRGQEIEIVERDLNQGYCNENK